MAYATKYYTGDGTTTDFLFDKPYIKEADVSALVARVVTAVTFVDPTTVRISPAPDNGDEVIILRQSDIEVATHAFPDLTYLKSQNLDGDFLQGLYLDQETQDSLTTLQTTLTEGMVPLDGSLPMTGSLHLGDGISRSALFLDEGDHGTQINFRNKALIPVAKIYRSDILEPNLKLSTFNGATGLEETTIVIADGNIALSGAAVTEPQSPSHLTRRDWVEAQILAAQDTPISIVADRAEAVLKTPIAGTLMYIESPDGAGNVWAAVTGAAPGTYTNNSASYTGTVLIPTGGDGSSGWLRDYNTGVYPQWFGAAVDNVTDDYTAILEAHTLLRTIGGGTLLFTGMCYCNTGIEIAPDNTGANLGITWKGVGWNSGLRADSDIEQLYYGTPTGTTLGISRFSLLNLKLERTTAVTYTKVNLRVTVAADVIIDKVFVINNETAAPNIGGLHFATSTATTYQGSVNQVINTRIQGGGLRTACRDSRFVNTWVWGQRTQYSVWSSGSGNIFSNVAALSSIPSGSFMFTSTAIGNRMESCTIDGSAPTGSSHGVVADRAFGLQIANCDFYTNYNGHAVYCKDMLRAIVTNNNFKDNNGGDNSFDDVRFESISLASNGNIIQGNHFSSTRANTNKGYAYREVNGGTAPGANKCIDNHVEGAAAYQATAILKLNPGTEIRGNTGMNTHARRSGTVNIPVGTNPSVSISHTSPYDPAITDLSIHMGANGEGNGITSWYVQRSSSSVMTLSARGTVTVGTTFNWQVDTL